jgi:hypothetical protein
MSHALSHAVSPAGACTLSPMEAQKLNCVSWGGMYSCLLAVPLSPFYQERASSIMYSSYCVYILYWPGDIFHSFSGGVYIYLHSLAGVSMEM